MILAFRPACTAPFAASQNSNRTARAGITQQALSVSPGLAFPNRRKSDRRTLFSRFPALVKRQLFEWAGREGAVHGRHALLRHFL
jgi:hypothetical protein